MPGRRASPTAMTTGQTNIAAAKAKRDLDVRIMTMAEIMPIHFQNLRLSDRAKIKYILPIIPAAGDQGVK